MNRGWRGRGARHPRGNRGFRGGPNRGNRGGGARGARGAYPRGGGSHEGKHRSDQRSEPGHSSDRPPLNPRPQHGGGGAPMERNDFQMQGSSDQNLPNHPQEMGFSQQAPDQDVPDYQWPPPDYQWPSGDESHSHHAEERFTQQPPPVAPNRGPSDVDDRRARKEQPPHEPVDMFQAGPLDRHPRQSPGMEQGNRGPGARRSLSPRHDVDNRSSFSEGMHRGRPDRHMDEQAQQAGSTVEDPESLRITVGNEHFFSSRAPLDHKPSAMDRLGPTVDRQPHVSAQDYNQHQHPSSFERDQRYRDTPADPGADHMHRSRSSSLEKPRFDAASRRQEMTEPMVREPTRRNGSKEKEMDYEHRRSRYDVAREEGNGSRERGQYKSHQDDHWKAKDRGNERGNERGKDADRSRRDDKPVEPPRPRDPRRDKDFLAERSKKPPSPLAPSDVSPLFHFLGKSESKKQSLDNRNRSTSQRPGIPPPTKSRHASSSASSPVSQTKPIESAPDVMEPPKVLKSILKKSILKKPKAAPDESREALVQQSPRSTSEQSPTSAPSQSPTSAPRQSPVTVQKQPFQSPQQEHLFDRHRQTESPIPAQSPIPLQLEPLPISSQPELIPMNVQPQHVPAVEQPVAQQPVQVHEPLQSEKPLSAALPLALSTEKISSLLSSLTGLQQGSAPSALFASQSESIGFQQQMQQQEQMQQPTLQPLQQLPMPQQMQLPLQQQVQQQVQQPTAFSQSFSQLQMPQQQYPASSQQIHAGMFQQSNPVVSQHMHQVVPQQATAASVQQLNPIQSFPLTTPQAYPDVSAQTHTVSSHQPYPAVSPQAFPTNAGQSYSVLSQQPPAPALALDEFTASKIRDLAQSLGKAMGTASSEPSIQKMFPQGEPESQSSFPTQMPGHTRYQPQAMTKPVQEQPQVQNISRSEMPPQCNQSNPYMSQSVEKPTEPVKSSNTGFVSVDDEDRFLYGDADAEEKHNQPIKAPAAPKPSLPETSGTAPKVEAPSQDQIKNILSAIGFDFGLAQKIQDQKEQKEQEKGSKASKTKKPDTVEKRNPVRSSDTGKVEPVQATVVPALEDNLKGLDKTASFLDSGIKMKTDQELDNFIRDAKKNVSKHKRQVSDNRDQTSGSWSDSRSSEKQKMRPDVEKTHSQIGTQRSSVEDKYVTDQEASSRGYSQYLPHEVADKQPQELYPVGQSQERHYQSAQDQLQPQGGTPQHSQQYPPVQQTVQFVSSAHDSFPVAGPNVTRDNQSFQPENIFISVNTAGDSSSNSNRVVLLPKPDPELNDRQRRILEIERRYQLGRNPEEVKQIIETEREKERRLRQEAEELIEKEKQRRREERRRKEEEERRRKEEEERKQKEEERKKKEEERKRREEERRRKEEEEKRRKDAIKEKEREFQRLLQSDPIDVEVFKNKVNSLETELEKLNKKNAEIKRQTYITSGHKDSLLSENNLQQDKICDQLRALRRRMNQFREEAEKKRESGSKERSRSRTPERRPSRDSFKPSRLERSSRDSKEATVSKEASKESTRTSSKENESSKGPKEKKLEDRQDVKAKVEKVVEPSEKTDKLLRFEFNYYDPGEHWCKLCNIQSSTLNDLFIHLHSKMHAKNCDPYDRPWMQDTLLKTKKKAANTIDAPIRGTEFMMPVNGFFCRLCKEFFGDGVCATEHLKTSKHNHNYEKYLEENTYYEKRLKIEKAAGRAQKLKLAVNQEREGKRKQDGGSDQDEDEMQSKKAKTEEQDIKMMGSKGQKGFGVFNFSKTEEESDVVTPKTESETNLRASQSQSKPEKTPPPPETKPAKPVPPPTSEASAPPQTAAEKKAALAAKLAPMVGRMRGPSNKFLLRKTATSKFPQPSKLVPQNVFPDSSKKSLTFDTLPVIKDKKAEAKENVQALKVTQSDIASAFEGKSVEEKAQPSNSTSQVKQSTPVSITASYVAPKDKPKAVPVQPKQTPHVKQAEPPKAKKTDLFGPALPPPPKRMALEDMDEDDVCVPGMDDDILPDFLPKPKPPPPVSATTSATSSSSTSAFASSSASNLYNIFYKPDD